MIAVDLDDTLNYLLDSWIAWINVTYGKDIDLSHILKWEDMKSFEGVDNTFKFLCAENYRNIPIKEGAQEFVQKLKEFDEVKIITASKSTAMEYKRPYVDKYFGKDIELVCEYDKYKCLKPNDILIDDGFHNVYPAVKEAGAVGILFNDYGRLRYADYLFPHPKFYRAKSYQQVIEIVKKRYK